MRRLAVHPSQDRGQIKGLLFFSQCIDELLYDHTYDSYRSPALNTNVRLIELHEVAFELEGSQFFARTLPLFLDELHRSVTDDPVISKAQASRLHAQVAALQKKLGQPSSALSTIRSMILDIDDYSLRLRQEILSAVLAPSPSYPRIRALAEAFTVQVEYEGYSRRYAYFVAQRLLVRRLRKLPNVNGRHVLQGFLTRLPREPSKKTFSLLFKVGIRFNHFAAQAESFGFRVVADAPDLKPLVPEAKAWVGSKLPIETFLFFDQLEAEDPLKAKEHAEYTLSTFSATVEYVSHTEELLHSKEALVFEPEVGGSIVRKAPDAMHCGREQEDRAADIVAVVAEVIQARHLANESTYRVRNALHYHSAALHAEHPGNQLVDLWAALEGLLLRTESSDSRITQVIKTLSPLLMLSYVDELFVVLSKELAEDPDANSVLQSITLDAPQIQRVAALCVCDEFAPQRSILEDKIATSNPLLWQRTMQLREKFGTQSKIRATLINHSKKVEWHLNRIYFTRNSIVHTAESLSYLPLLIQHLHTYVDTALRVVAATAIRASIATTLDQVTAYASSLYSNRIELLGAKGDEMCNLSNYVRLLIGDANPITQFNL